MNIIYLWSKFIKKLPSSAVKDTILEKPAKIEARSTVIKSRFGRYSYCGYSCIILNAEIGRFCSIADNVTIGLSQHPMSWVSTSCAFYHGRDSVPKNLAKLNHDSFPVKTKIGNGAVIKQGVQIGDGAVIGMGAIVTKDVAPYSIVVGVPAKHINYRFDEDTVKKLLEIKWWDYEIDRLANYTQFFDDPTSFIEQIQR